jgi:hypothetical protein
MRTPSTNVEDEVINPHARFTVSSYPYNHLIVEDCFDEATQYGLAAACNDLVRLGKPIGKVGEHGDLIYDALNYAPAVEQIRQLPISVFASAALKNLIVDVFDIALDENFMLGVHRHEPPSRDGWSHTDFAIVSFPDSPPNFGGQRLYSTSSGCNYSDDSKHRQPESLKTARSVACLYFTANEPWSPGMGGETGIYLPDGTTLVAAVPPKNNLLLAFEISPLSFHGYRGSATMQRNSFIWWYHSAPGYLLARHADAVQARVRGGGDPWDRWTDSTVEKYEPPPYP